MLPLVRELVFVAIVAMKLSKLHFILFILIFAAIVVVGNKVVGSDSFAVPAVYPVYTDNTMTAENEMALINQQRATVKLPKLAESTKLDTSACDKLNDMVKYQYWAHVSPSGVQPWHWFDVEGYKYTRAGENLAYGQQDAQELVTAWMNSPEHKANILDKNYTEQGMCIEQVQFMGQTTYLSVSHFGEPQK